MKFPCTKPLVNYAGSGKTLGYMLPSLTHAIENQETVLVLAPTRELAVQLARDTSEILENLVSLDIQEGAVLLTVRGINIPTPEQLYSASVLIGTPSEMHHVLSNIQGGQDFIAGGLLSTIILDEVDVLLPLAPKKLRTTLDNNDIKDRKRGGNSDSSYLIAQEERRKKEKKRKVNALKRSGVEISADRSIVTPTEKILKMIASRRFIGGDESKPYQLVAGSATASRRTLERLNNAMRAAASDSALPFDIVFNGKLSLCRHNVVEDQVANNNMNNDKNKGKQVMQEELETSESGRKITIPKEVTHKYVILDKDTSVSPESILEIVARVTKTTKPKSALLFICGEFGKNKQREKIVKNAKEVIGGTAKTRRKAKRINNAIITRQKTAQEENQSKALSLSARRACSILEEYGVKAQPLHVALGLEGANSGTLESNLDENSLFVTFEGSSRGLHFEGIEMVFIVGRPSSPSSYLHLAGRVGRYSVADQEGSVVRPGTVISMCTEGAKTELAKWTEKLGEGIDLHEMILDRECT